MGFPPPVHAARGMAAVIIRQRDSIFQEATAEPHVGIHWATKFYKRHPELKAVTVAAMDWSRSGHAIYDKLVAWC